MHSAVVVGPISKKSESHNKANTNRKERERSDDSGTEALFEESNSVMLVEQINKLIPKETFAQFVKIFMLETNVTAIRWQAHGLIQAIYK